jgi:L-histidine N-alpha-methyltransferase
MSDFPARFREAFGSGTAVVEAPGTGDTLMSFARSVAVGLSADPKWLHCRFLYDAEGSRIFEAITAKPEYYPTRTEAAILERHAAEIRELTGLRTLVELGSGYSVKTEHLLSAYSGGDEIVHYVPVDVSISALNAANQSIDANFADVQFTGINGTYGSAFPVLRQLSPQLVIFLGSTIGNFNEAESGAFWRSVADHLPVGGYFLLGVDLVKDAGILEAAYNDSAGHTARFTKNYCTRLNRELGANIDVSQVEHVAVWNPDRERMDISLRFNTAQQIIVGPLGETFEIAAGEEILIEISRKFRIPRLSTDLARFGFQVARSFTDENEWFALLLLERVEDVIRAPNPSVVQ